MSLPDEFHVDGRICKIIKRAVIWPTSLRIPFLKTTVGYAIGVGAAEIYLLNW